MCRRLTAAALVALFAPFAAPSPVSAAVTRYQSAAALKGADFIVYTPLTCSVGGEPFSQMATVVGQRWDSRPNYSGPANFPLSYASLHVFSEGPCGFLDLSTATYDLPPEQVTDTSSVASNLKTATIAATFPVSDNGGACTVLATIAVSLTAGKAKVGTHTTLTEAGPGYHVMSHTDGKLASAVATGTVTLAPSAGHCLNGPATIAIDSDQGSSDTATIQDVKYHTLQITKD